MTQETSTLGNDFTVKAGLAQMLKGGVIMDVVNAEQVRSSEVAAVCSMSESPPEANS